MIWKRVIFMKKGTLIVSIFLSIILIIVYTALNTYSVIINITDKEGTTEIVNKINIIDLLTNDDGSYNDTYYLVKDELSVNEEEANILINSSYLNDSLQIVLNSIVDYRYHNKLEARLSDDEIYNMIVDAVNKDMSISEDLRNRVIIKSSRYKDDVSDFLYDISVSVVGEI